jgi:hypothetical protein
MCASGYRGARGNFVSGYTPLFDSLTRGTLCGKWPDIGLWPVLLSMADWRGEIDATQQYIATVTGLSVIEVTECITRFCEPDPRSRSQDAHGARLALVNPERDWGWRIVNIQKYRRQASDMKQIADGRNAEKVRRYKERHKTPTDTAGHRPTPSNTNSNSNSNSNKNSEALAPVDKSAALPRSPLNGSSPIPALEEAERVWGELTSSGGRIPERTPRLQAVIDAVGGMPRIRLRTEFENAKLKSAFCEAYLKP